MNQVLASDRPSATLGVFERYLTLWVALCIIAGIALGGIAPAPIPGPGLVECRQRQYPGRAADLADDRPDAAAGRFRRDRPGHAALARHPRHAGDQLADQAVLDGAAGLAVHPRPVSPLLPADQIDSYIAGLILLAAAPCTAMVFVWSNLSGGDPNFTLSRWR